MSSREMEKKRSRSRQEGDRVVSPGGTVKYTSGQDYLRYSGHLSSSRLGRSLGRIFYSGGERSLVLWGKRVTLSRACALYPGLNKGASANTFFKHNNPF